jgi:hypothetical protein
VPLGAGPGLCHPRLFDARRGFSGELCVRFAELHLVEGDAVVATVPTYRGEGQAFL